VLRHLATPPRAIITAMSRPWRWPQLRLRPALVVLAALLAFGLWQGTTVLLAHRAAGDPIPWARPFFWELTGGLAAFATFWIPITAVLNAPRPAPPARFLAIHAGALLGFSALKSTLMIGSRFLTYPALGWGAYEYPLWPVHLAMEAMKDAVAYGVIAVGYGLLRAWRDRQALALREAALAGELKEARLQALLGQVNPHFLFNALNTVSSVMYEDLERTDRLLSQLAQVLRAGLEGDRPTWSLTEEKAHTDLFFALLHARFGDRLQLAWDLDPALGAVPVPRFSFQLLLENAVKHNQDRTGPLEIRLRARRDGDAVRLEAEDTGRGFGQPSPARGAGLGLRHLEQALALLHGGRARLERGAGPEGGARVRVTVPVEA
jgi:two-component system, LytTR family, sensor kinase